MIDETSSPLQETPRQKCKSGRDKHFRHHWLGLCKEHRREVRQLRRENSSLRASLASATAARSSAAIPACQSEACSARPSGDAAAADIEQLCLVYPKRIFNEEACHATAPAAETNAADEAVEDAEMPRRTSVMSATPRVSPDDQRDAMRKTVVRAKAKAVFVDAEAMKDKIRQAAIKPEYDVANFYKKSGLWQLIARDPYFEYMTLTVIAANAIWIAVDTDHNDSILFTNSRPVFQIAEYTFCYYFCMEWLIRFMSFKKKHNCVRDAWFVFDSCLVSVMATETWVVSGYMLFIESGTVMEGTSFLSLARLLRLMRMARMARLLRAMPELLILIKGMFAAMKSVFFTLCLLTLFVYVFGIAFTQLCRNDSPRYFGTVGESMHTLLLDGTLMDGTGNIVKILREEGLVYVAVWYIFVLLSALTVMNMLIGVLCEVVSAVAATEKEGIVVSCMREQLEDVWLKTKGGVRRSSVNSKEDGEEKPEDQITKNEFTHMLEDPGVCRALEESGVDPIAMVDNIDFIFQRDFLDEDDEEFNGDKKLSFGDFVELVLEMRGSNTATVKDIVDMRKHVAKLMEKLIGDFQKILEEVHNQKGGKSAASPGGKTRQSKSRQSVAARNAMVGDDTGTTVASFKPHDSVSTGADEVAVKPKAKPKRRTVKTKTQRTYIADDDDDEELKPEDTNGSTTNGDMSLAPTGNMSLAPTGNFSSRVNSADGPVIENGGELYI